MYYNPPRLAMDGGYHGSVMGIQLYAKKYGMEVIGLDAPLQPGDMVWLETPKNPSCEVADVEKFSHICSSAKATLCVDATFAPPPLQVTPKSAQPSH